MMENKSGIERFQTGFLYFWVYSALGWLYEVFLEAVSYTHLDVYKRQALVWAA